MMPFPYTYICDLLQALEDSHRKPPKSRTPPQTTIKSWFQKHRTLLNDTDTNASAILSTLLPERRTDRVYFIQAAKLEGIFIDTLILGTSRRKELNRYTEPGSGLDLADCIESLLTVTPFTIVRTIAVEEIDETLSQIAAACRFSSEAVRSLPKTHDSKAALTKIYLCLRPRDAKWFTRLVLKNYEPVAMNSYSVFRNYHPLLPRMMQIQDNMSTAGEFLRQINNSPPGSLVITDLLKPQVGTKVGRQPWFKGRSIQHCMNMACGRKVICEQKMDGEYCQIHIDLSKPSRPIQIFSKSGKDSTADRKGLHKAIRRSLKIGQDDCSLKRSCILEGELLVYSTKENQVLPFHKIRKHVTRSGSFLGTDNDSQAHDHEHLMILYYDVLLIDDESLLGMKNSDRFKRLASLVTCRKGYAELVSRTAIHTARSTATANLREIFAKCILSRDEGLVLKPDEPYFDFSSHYGQFGCCNIKMKKEYFSGFGDVGDFAVVGASYDPAKARRYNIPRLKWTDFWIGCLENRDKVHAKTEKPHFRITNVVELSGEVLTAFWASYSSPWQAIDDNDTIRLDFGPNFQGRKPQVVFPEPLVFDMRCFVFDKAHNTNFWSMRFPQVSKVHYDRSYLDTISFSELQDIVNESNVPRDEDSQEMREWISKLQELDRGKASGDSASQASTARDSLPSPSSSISSQPKTAQFSHALPTPPVSSDFDVPSSQDSASSGKASRRVKSPKRRATESIESQTGTQERMALSANKRRCTRSSRRSPPPSSPSDEQLKRQSQREPLSQTDANVSVKPTNAIQCEMEDLKTRANTRSYCSAVSCTIAGAKCLLANCSVLLSPYISDNDGATLNNLLKQHGVLKPLSDPQAWKEDGKALSRSTTQGCDKNPPRQQRQRKVCLVDPSRELATAAFVQKIEDANLQKKNGRREWVPVYDWRVLQTITDEEKKSSKSKDPWMAHHIGIA
ncbi:hypothetical protein F5Y16DRAFT_421337 [Xylariaceae sp. FL0255]|nr:hypothetical protein F5Y16DRAFT_421337 [Xylariaceae sp. FL0255]